MYENPNKNGVQLKKAVYALSCPVCGAECRSQEDGSCPYCGAYLDFVDNTQPVQPPPVSFPAGQLPPNAEKKVRAWKTLRLIYFIVYPIIAVFCLGGILLLEDGMKGYDAAGFAAVLVYIPMSVFMPVILSVTRPDKCFPLSRRLTPKPLAYVLFTVFELTLFAVLLTFFALQGEDSKEDHAPAEASEYVYNIGEYT